MSICKATFHHLRRNFSIWTHFRRSLHDTTLASTQWYWKMMIWQDGTRSRLLCMLSVYVSDVEKSFLEIWVKIRMQQHVEKSFDIYMQGMELDFLKIIISSKWFELKKFQSIAIYAWNNRMLEILSYLTVHTCVHARPKIENNSEYFSPSILRATSVAHAASQQTMTPHILRWN